MSEDALGSVVLLRNAAAHAGHIKQQLAAIIQVRCLCYCVWAGSQCVSKLAQPAASVVQSSGALKADWFPVRLSGPAVKVCPSHHIISDGLLCFQHCTSATVWMLLQVLQGSLPAEYQELREPSVPDLSYALDQVDYL